MRAGPRRRLSSAASSSKEASTTDARGVVLRLTRKGRGLHGRTMRLIARRNDETFAMLTAAERRTLGDLLDRVAQGLQDD